MGAPKQSPHHGRSQSTPAHPLDTVPRMAMAITTATVVGIFAIGLISDTALKFSLFDLAIKTACMALLLTVHLPPSFPESFPRLRASWKSALGAQTLLTYSLFFDTTSWGTPTGLLAASAIRLLRRPWGVPAFAAAVTSAPLVGLLFGRGARDVARETVAALVTGLLVAGVSSLSGMARRVSRSRAEMIQHVVDQERLRFSRDLHDLLGLSLSTIALKCELANRLLKESRNGQARDELAEILRLARQGLTDVRAVSSGYQSISLTREADSAKSVLTSLGVDTLVRIDPRPLPREVDTVLATVIREAVTNMLRHSHVQRCRIEATRDSAGIRLSIVNDAAKRPVPPEPTCGQGIANLYNRVREIGGEMRIETYGDEFRLLVAMPARVLNLSQPPLRRGSQRRSTVG